MTVPFSFTEVRIDGVAVPVRDVRVEPIEPPALPTPVRLTAGKFEAFIGLTDHTSRKFRIFVRDLERLARRMKPGARRAARRRRKGRDRVLAREWIRFQERWCGNRASHARWTCGRRRTRCGS